MNWPLSGQTKSSSVTPISLNFCFESRILILKDIWGAKPTCSFSNLERGSQAYSQAVSMRAMCFSSVLGELNQPEYVTYEIKSVPVYRVNTHLSNTIVTSRESSPHKLHLSSSLQLLQQKVLTIFTECASAITSQCLCP